MSEIIYTVPEKWRLDLFKHPPKSFQIYDETELYEITHLELMTESAVNLKENNLRYGCAHFESTKKMMSEYWINFYKTERGKEKRKAVSEKNKEIKSDELKEKWKDPDFRKKMELRSYAKPKDFGKKMSEIRKEYWKKNKSKVVKKLFIEGVVYNNAFDAAEVYNIHPVNIRRKCRLPQYKDWSYLK